MQQINGAGLLGFGMNVVLATPNDAVTSAIVTPATGCSTTYTYNGVDYCVPDNVSLTPGFGDNTTNGNVIVGGSRSDFQSKFSAALGITGSYNAFSAVFNAAFANELQSQEQYWYGMVSGDYQAYVLLLQEEAGQYLDPAFVNDPDVQNMLQQPSFDPTSPGPFFQVFEKWGTHFVYQVAMGASLQYFAAVSAAYSSSEQTISSNLQLEYNAVFVQAGMQAKADWQTLGQTWSQDRSVSSSAIGGNSSLLSGLDPSEGDNFNTQFEQWRSSIPANLGVQQYYLRDLSTLFSGTTQTAVSQALSAYLACGLFAQGSYTIVQDGWFVNTAIASQIQVGAQTVPPPTPLPTNNVLGGMQLLIVDSTSLQPLANVAVCPQSSSEYGAAWNTLQAAVAQVSAFDYFTVLSVFGVMDASAFPTPGFATWLQSCGATLAAWQRASQAYSGDNYNIGYTCIGQQGLPAG